MSNAAVHAAFSNSSSSPGEYLLIKQKDYEDNAGVVTMLDITKVLEKLLELTSASSSSVNCGMNEDGKSFYTTVYVYPYPETLVYAHDVTNGIATSAGSNIVTETEELNFSLSTEVALKYPVHSVISSKWVDDDIFYSNGDVAYKPAITIKGNKATTVKQVYGVMEVVYKTKRDSYDVLISARPTASENVFQSVFYARFDGGIEVESLTPPPNAEENYAAGVTCGDASYIGGSNVTVIPPEEGGTPTIEPDNIVEYLDYCKDY